MRWANLPPEHYPFKTVSSYETYHFSKPHPAYFAEVLGAMGWPDGPVLMVGDDNERDLTGASRLGLPTFWINNSDIGPPERQNYKQRGSIGEVRPWLEAINLSNLEPNFSTPNSLMALMLASPASIQGLLSRVHESFMNKQPRLEEWSLIDILCHLRDTERDINLSRIKLILEQDGPFIAARNTDFRANKSACSEQNAKKTLMEFVSARLETLDILTQASPSDWMRTARHAIFGPTNLLEMVKFMTEHDRLHIRQIWSTLKQLDI